MLTRALRPALRRRPRSSPPTSAPRRWMTPAPRPGDGPLMTRRADRELPDIETTRFRWSRTLPLFLAVVAASSLAIFNYQKTSSPIVAAALYALRTSPAARERLGDDVYFRRAIPWIAGDLNQLRGRVDIEFGVRGSRASGTVRFRCRRCPRSGVMRTDEWSLTMDEGGERVDLLGEGAADPFGDLLADAGVDDGFVPAAAEADAGPTRGYRQQGVLNK